MGSVLATLPELCSLCKNKGKNLRNQLGSGIPMTPPAPQKPALNLWEPLILLLLGMVAGIAMTLWAVRRFGLGVASSSSTPTVTVGEASREKAPQSEPGTNIPGTKPQAVAVASQVSNDGQFRFDLQGCRRTENDVLCELQITNLTGKEIDFVLNGSSQPKTLAYTDNGLEFQAVNPVLGSRSDYYSASQTLVSQIPTPASLKFQQMPQTSQLSLLKIGYRYRSLETAQWLEGNLEFRPVPLIQ